MSVVESSISDSIGLDPSSSLLDSQYAGIELAQGSCLIERCRFERSGVFDSKAVGAGGVEVLAPTGGSTVPSWEFSNVECKVVILSRFVLSISLTQRVSPFQGRPTQRELVQPSTLSSETSGCR